MSDHSTLAGTALHEDKRIKQSVRAASAATVTLSSPGATLDGVTLVNGDRILLKNQTSGAENGIYTWSGAATALVRTADANTATLLFHGFKVFVREGTTNATTYWTFQTTATITLGTTSLTFAKDGAGSGSVTSVGLSMPTGFSVTGSPVTSTGTLAVSESTQSANTVKAGPASGAAAAPTYRALVAADVPVMVASGASHAAGAAPDPGVTAGSTKFLREDASWAVPGAVAGTSSMGVVAIQTQAPSATGTVTFSVPAGFKNLRVSGTLRSTVAAATDVISIRFNGDTAANYGRQTVYGVGTGTASDAQNTGQTSATLGNVPGSTAVANSPASFTISIPDHTQTSFNKQGFWNEFDLDGTAVTNALTSQTGFYWSSTAAITSVTLLLASGNFVSGSTITLWGESDASAQSSTAPAVASSGTISTSGLAVSRVSPTGAVTGVILQAGSYPGQMIRVVNEAVAANTITFAASGTSNVADGTSDVIAGLTARLFVWDSATSLWYRAA